MMYTTYLLQLQFRHFIFSQHITYLRFALQNLCLNVLRNYKTYASNVYADQKLKCEVFCGL